MGLCNSPSSMNKKLPAAPCCTGREAMGAGRAAPRLRCTATHTARGPAACSGPHTSHSRVGGCPKSSPTAGCPCSREPGGENAASSSQLEAWAVRWSQAERLAVPGSAMSRERRAPGRAPRSAARGRCGSKQGSGTRGRPGSTQEEKEEDVQPLIRAEEAAA